MSVLIEALNELTAAEYTPGKRADVTTLDGWEIVKSGHGLDRNTEREAESEIDGLIARVVKRLISPVQRITRPGEYMFFSKGLNRGAIFNVDLQKPQLRVVTILPPGKNWARPGTRSVFVEGAHRAVLDIIEIE